MIEMELLGILAGINYAVLTKRENLLVEGIIYKRLCDGLEEWYRCQYENYLRLVHMDIEKESFMFGYSLARCIVKDILETQDYTLRGIACYTDTPEEVVYEIAMGCNLNPSSNFLRRLIKLHHEVKPDLYHVLIKKALL